MVTRRTLRAGIRAAGVVRPQAVARTVAVAASAHAAKNRRLGFGVTASIFTCSLTDHQEIKGLTTAASIWLTAAIGVAAAVGPLWVPVACAVSAWIILSVFGHLTTRIRRSRRSSD